MFDISAFPSQDEHLPLSAVFKLLPSYSYQEPFSSLTIHSRVLPRLSCFGPATLLPAAQWDIKVSLTWQEKLINDME